MTTRSWRLDAKCKGMDHNIFHPSRGGPIRPALAICNGCPVQTQCAADAPTDLPQGVWGGIPADERRRTQAARNRYRAAS